MEMGRKGGFGLSVNGDRRLGGRVLKERGLGVEEKGEIKVRVEWQKEGQCVFRSPQAENWQKRGGLYIVSCISIFSQYRYSLVFSSRKVST